MLAWHAASCKPVLGHHVRRHARSVQHSRAGRHYCSANRSPDTRTHAPTEKHITTKQILALAASGSVLGPLCDGQHSKYGVLYYTNPSIVKLPGSDWHLETCWWVPPLFGMAAIIIGAGHTVLDHIVQHRQKIQKTGSESGVSWSFVMSGIATFVLQYAASGALEAPLQEQQLAGLPLLDVLLASTALLHWYSFDRSLQGALMASITALAGPGTEMFLINKLGLYHYSHPAVWGIPTWIPWVYFCGCPAVGNLGRKISSVLRAQLAS